MGADIAAWKQAVRAELAAAAAIRVGYGQALLDLVKAFDRILHWLLVQEAVAPKTNPANESSLYWSSGLQTHHCREWVGSDGDEAGHDQHHPQMHASLPQGGPSCFVDDPSAEMTGPDKHIEEELGGERVILHVANSFCENEMELSSTKCVCVCVCVFVCVLCIYALTWRTVAGKVEGAQHPLQQGGRIVGCVAEKWNVWSLQEHAGNEV